MKKIILITMLLMFVPIVFATDMGFVGQNTSLWSDILDGVSYYDSTSANITIYYPNGTLALSNVAMTKITTGTYLYNFTSNQTGIHYTKTQYYNGTTLIATATSTFYIAQAQLVESNNMSAIAVIIALSVVTILFLYMGLRQSEDNSGTGAVWKVLCLIIAMLTLVLLAWATIDANQNCVFIANGVTATQVCEAGQMNQGTMLLKLMLVVMTIFFIWISVALFIQSMEYLRSTGKM